VDQSVELRVRGRGHARMPVPEHRGSDATGEVEVRLAVRVVDAVAFPVIPGTLEVARHDRREMRLGLRGEPLGGRGGGDQRFGHGCCFRPSWS